MQLSLHFVTYFQNFQIMATAEQKIHEGFLKKARDEWNEEQVKRLDFINKRLRESQDAKQTITDLKDGMREYYQVFGRRIKSLPKEPVFSDF